MRVRSRTFVPLLNRNLVCVLLKYSGIFFLYGYLSWFLYIRLVSLAGSYITGLTVLTLYVVNSV